MGYGPAYGVQRSADAPANGRLRLALFLGRLAFLPYALSVLALVLNPVAEPIPGFGVVTWWGSFVGLGAIFWQFPLVAGLVGLAFAAFEPADDPENASARSLAMAVNTAAIGVHLLAMYWLSQNPLWT